MPARAVALLDAAEARVRAGGYDGFSFRDLAADVGIKSASVHYHFPTKEALVAALAERYSQRFFAGLADAPTGPARVSAYRAAFGRAMAQDGAMCLCGVLGAAAPALPAPVAAGAAAFMRAMVKDLAAALADAPDPRGRALAVVAQLEGAMLLARALGDPGVFDQATEGLAC